MVYHDISQEQLLLLITQAVQAELQKRSRQVPVGISVRHIHLTRDDVDKLFGYGYQLTPKKALSQPGQFACEECLDIIGPKGELKHVRILGPERSATQIELAQTDCRNIGIKAPVRSSGDTKGTPGVTLRGPNGTLTVPEGVMIADRHIHMTPAQAAAFGLADGDRVQVKIDGPKPGVMGGVLIRAKRQMCTGFSHRHGRWQCLPAQAGAAGHRAGQRGVSYDFRDRQGDRCRHPQNAGACRL